MLSFIAGLKQSTCQTIFWPTRNKTMCLRVVLLFLPCMWSNLFRWFGFRRNLPDDLKLARLQVLLQAFSFPKQINTSEMQPSSYKTTKKRDKKLFEFQRLRDWAKSKDFIRHNSEWKWNGESVHTFPEGWLFERSEVHFTLWTKPRKVFNRGFNRFTLCSTCSNLSALPWGFWPLN